MLAVRFHFRSARRPSVVETGRDGWRKCHKGSIDPKVLC
jgi:hypothetical protein